MPVGGDQSFCSVEWTDRPVNHLAIDPVHGLVNNKLNVTPLL